MFSLTASPLTALLLFSNLGISLYALYKDDALFDRWAFVPERVANHGEWYRMISAGFLHGGIAHLAFNCITLYSFGPYLEYQLGAVNFIIVYFGSLVIAHFFLYGKYKDNPAYVAVGASGAISGIILGFCLFEPFAKLYLMFIPIGIPAFIFAIGFAGYSYWASNQPPGKSMFGRIAHEAHLGGAVGGLILTILVEPRVIPRLFETIADLF